MLLAERENQGSQLTMSDFKEIIQEIGNTMKSQESSRLALSIQQSLYGNIKKQNKNVENWGVRRAPFIVLLGVNTPSVLTEVTCLSNQQEEKKLNNENYRREIAQYLEEGIIRYLHINHKNKGEVEHAAKRTTNQK
jgi:N-acetylmuramoyl-L-alanine amidase